MSISVQHRRQRRMDVGGSRSIKADSAAANAAPLRRPVSYETLSPMERKQHIGALSPDDRMVEDHLDCTGTMRTFQLSLYAEGRFLEAVELRQGEPVGLRFVLPVKVGEVPPWGEMRDLIRERLAKKHIVQDKKGELHLLHRIVRAQLSDREQQSDEPHSLIVDDRVVSWEELGRLLLPYAGFGLRIEIRETGEE